MRVEVWPTDGHPAVFAEWEKLPGKPTLLVYGHHDVQPVDPLPEWKSPPFEPTVREGRLWGRGVVDDKGQVHIHAKAVESFVRTAGALPINLKMIVEGEEEIGSSNLDILMRERAKDLASDFVCVSDTAMFGRGHPLRSASGFAVSRTSRSSSRVQPRTFIRVRSAARWPIRSTCWPG